MRKLILSIAVTAAAIASIAPAQARDSKMMMSLEKAMAANDAQSRLGGDVKFYFGKQATPKMLEQLGTDKTSQKTNSFGKSPETACNWAFLSAMLRLQERARELGANAVVNIVSNYKNVEMSSETEFECHDGAMMTGVALKADFVKVKP
ncbi:excinuclease ATPase subunit [Telluria aromaticivorans]|uniref:Excinuclease ATPase subunit n=1 Tax=Telluria aromaticivorans TaxID=2725995 RepID=A0A7Y2JWS3_9BURK|nr:excinuclease ATPase subunit [Telluria aromaticivorans]NNG21858.1 excinuclease ATPase subunit [Telluria aromaticivorans]